MLLWGATLFPILYVIGTHANLYDGVRHLLFVFPLLFIISASGWVAAWRSAGRWRPGVALIATLGLLEPVAFQVRNHPSQTAYIQPLAGGPAYAFARYDLDYWGNCLLEGLATVDRNTPGDHVYVSGWPLLVLQADLTRFPRLVLVEPDDPRATRFVTLARGSRTELLALAAFPGIESRISTADGALLCTVSRVAPPRMTPTLPH